MTPDKIREFKKMVGIDVLPPLDTLLNSWKLLHDYTPETGLFKVKFADEARLWMIQQYEEMIGNYLAHRYTRYRLQNISDIETDSSIRESAGDVESGGEI